MYAWSACDASKKLEYWAIEGTHVVIYFTESSVLGQESNAIRVVDLILKRSRKTLIVKKFKKMRPTWNDQGSSLICFYSGIGVSVTCMSVISSLYGNGLFVFILQVLIWTFIAAAVYRSLYCTFCAPSSASLAVSNKWGKGNRFYCCLGKEIWKKRKKKKKRFPIHCKCKTTLYLSMLLFIMPFAVATHYVKGLILLLVQEQESMVHKEKYINRYMYTVWVPYCFYDMTYVCVSFQPPAIQHSISFIVRIEINRQYSYYFYSFSCNESKRNILLPDILEKNIYLGQ